MKEIFEIIRETLTTARICVLSLNRVLNRTNIAFATVTGKFHHFLLHEKLQTLSYY